MITKRRRMLKLEGGSFQREMEAQHGSAKVAFEKNYPPRPHD